MKKNGIVINNEVDDLLKGRHGSVRCENTEISLVNRTLLAASNRRDFSELARERLFFIFNMLNYFLFDVSIKKNYRHY